MDRESLEILIGPDGEVKVKVEGKKGPACLDVRDFFREFLGPVESAERTGEFYEEKNLICLDQKVKGKRGSR